MEKAARQKVQKGHRYGSWVIISDAQRFGSDTRYLCQCACGQEKMVSAITLRNGSSTHCGCLRKERPPKVCDFELRTTPPEIQEIYQLISKGCLPPADQFSMKDGAPSWTLPAIARILGLPRQELIEHLQGAGDRFNTGERRQSEDFFAAAV